MDTSYTRVIINSGLFAVQVKLFSLTKDLSTKLSVPREVHHHPPSPAQHDPPGPRSSGLCADDLARPGLVFRPWVEVYELHLHRLHLQVLGRDPAHFVRDLVALDRDILPLDV